MQNVNSVELNIYYTQNKMATNYINGGSLMTNEQVLISFKEEDRTFDVISRNHIPSIDDFKLTISRSE